MDGKKNQNANSPRREPRPATVDFRKAGLAILLLFLVFLVFYNTLTNGFVFDDTSMIKGNSAIRSARYIKYYFTRPFFSIGQPVTGPVNYDYYRPLVLVSYFLDFQLWKESPLGYHLTNILLQSLAAALLFFVLHKLRLSVNASFLAALLFAIHPALSDSTAGVSGRSDALCAVFLLPALLSYLNMRMDSSRKRAWIFLLGYEFFFVLALLAKENAFAFPLLLTAYEFIGPGREYQSGAVKKIKALLPAYLIAIAYFFWRALIVRTHFQLDAGAAELARKAITAAVVAGDYLLKGMLPKGLYFEKFTPQVESPLGAKVIVSAAILSILAGAAFFARKKSPKACFFICWFFIFLMPFSYFFLFQDDPLFFTPPHYLYFPLIGLAAASISLLEAGAAHVSSIRWRVAAFAPVAVILILLGLQTRRRNLDWRDEFTFFSSMLRHHPLSARTYIGMGNVFLKDGLPGYALAQYAKAYVTAKSVSSDDTGASAGKAGATRSLTIADYYAAAARSGMGDAYLALQETPYAVEQYEAGVKENAFDATIHYRLARAYEMIGAFSKSMASYDVVLKLAGQRAKVQLARELAFQKKTAYEQAKDLYQSSVAAGQAKSADAYYTEGLMLRLTGNRTAAESLLRKAIEQDPLHFGANLTLGKILSEDCRHEDAFANFSAAFASDPGSAVAAKELALTSLVLDDAAGAAQWAAKAHELAPDDYDQIFVEGVQKAAERKNQRTVF